MTNPNLSIYCGHYFSEESLLARQIILVDDILFYQRNAESKTELISTGENIFQIKETELFLQFDLSGKTKTMTMQEKEYSDTIFQEYFPEIFDPVKFLAKAIEKVYGTSYSEPAECLNYLNYTADLRKERLEHELSYNDQPALSFTPLKDKTVDLRKSGLTLSKTPIKPLPESDEDIAFAPLTDLSKWIKTGKLSSERLTNIYLNRLKQYGDVLKCVITLTADLAIEQARQADLEIAQGKYRGHLHGIPYGLKDIVETKGIITTGGLEYLKDRVSTEDAYIVELLQAAGAVLLGKLSLGTLGGGRECYIGKTINPWNLKENAGGSSSGSGSASSAGLVAFAIGAESWGSIECPAAICGVIGLRPSYGRISNRGVFPCFWTLDKVGVICRSSEDSAIVLSVLNVYDDEDSGSKEVSFYFDGNRKQEKYKAGYFPDWFSGEDVKEETRIVLNDLVKIYESIEISIPDICSSLIDPELEYFAAYDDFYFHHFKKISHEKDKNALQDVPNYKLLPAIEFLHQQQLRKKMMKAVQNIFKEVDFLIVPPSEDPACIIFNLTGHPSLTIPCGLDKNGMPYAITLIGRMYDEGTICRAGMELEKLFNFKERPKAYKQETV